MQNCLYQLRVERSDYNGNKLPSLVQLSTQSCRIFVVGEHLFFKNAFFKKLTSRDRLRKHGHKNKEAGVVEAGKGYAQCELRDSHFDFVRRKAALPNAVLRTAVSTASGSNIPPLVQQAG